MTESTKARRIGSTEESAFLDLIRTADILTRGVVRVLKTEDLSTTQYNIIAWMSRSRRFTVSS
jgi:hypothetical protein